MDGFWEHFGFQNRCKTGAISGVIFEGSKKRTATIGDAPWQSRPPPKDTINRILSELKETLSPVPKGNSNQDRGLLPGP